VADDLDALCAKHGIAASYVDIWGAEHAVPDATKRALLAAIGPDEPVTAASIPPERCATLADGARVFGPAAQLYALRSRRNWGIGDFTDLATLVQLSARHGASFVGVNPLHELFLDRPADASPYSPSSRFALNPWYLDVEAIADFAQSADVQRDVAAPDFQARLASLRALDLVDYAGVAAVKRAILTRLFERFRREHLAPMTARGVAFREYVDSHLRRIHDAALFDALQARFGVWGWPAWPEAYRDRNATAVRDFAREHASEVDFYLYLQWQADLQLAHAAQVARDAGMPIGLYRDLAVGANPGGAETWQDPKVFARGVHVGAPPDDFNPAGQDWGLPPWIPQRLQAAAYEPWADLLRANMRHAGALRIDHVLGLSRLFWVPEAATPADGAYVTYPLRDLLAILGRESAAHACLVIGEDLGTVAEELRDALAEAGVYSYRVLYFQRGDDYPAQALVTVSTHDLPTLKGFWQQRPDGRAPLLAALGREEVTISDALTFDDVIAIHRYLARTPCALMSVQLEDVFGEVEQANVPATTDDERPNWRRKVGVDLDDFERDGRFATLLTAIRNERP
jgi:(1->4)-alpha-D-glucan 1-alpha-D-glucosylmutase